MTNGKEEKTMNHPTHQPPPAIHPIRRLSASVLQWLQHAHCPKGREPVSERPEDLPLWLSQLLCRLGLHDDHLIEVVAGFGGGGPVEKYECTRCGRIITRQG